MLGPDPGPARTWYMVSTKSEAVGTFLVACAIFAVSRAAPAKKRQAWDCAGIFFALLAGLTKESFVLVLPALAALRIWLEAKQAHLTLWEGVRRLKWPMMMYAAIFSALVKTYDQKQAGNLVLLAEALEGSDLLANVSGPKYLEKLASETPGPATAVHFAKIVAGKAKDLKEGVAIGVKTLDSGAAAARLKQLVAVSNG